MKIQKMIILGFGQRGDVYASYIKARPDEFELVAIVDNNEERRDKARREFSCPIYSDYRRMLDDNLKADIVAVATQDCDHLEHAKACMEKGYNILLEKPIATKLSDCLNIAKLGKKYGTKVIVCHVLRYSPFYRKVKEIVDQGLLGDIITLNASENVGFWHQAHSFVRGPWRNAKQSAPMILAKCCHDMDIIRWLINKKPLAVSSVGNLKVYKGAYAPEGSADFCSDCKVDCVYRAQALYLEHKNMAKYFDTSLNQSDENILKSLHRSSYDRCVYSCDNDVVDHQNTVITFEDGVTASHVMTAFSKDVYRDLKIHGTKGELVGLMEDNYLELRTFGGETIRIDIPTPEETIGGHGGGDMGLMHDTYLNLNNQTTSGITYIDVSADSHKIAFAAEKSRLGNGRRVRIK